MIEDDALATHRQEVRRGTVVLACLLILQNPDYGYSLLEPLQERGFDVDASTLYPLLRRLEKQGLLVSHWDTEGARPRKYYVTSEDGVAFTATLLHEWNELHSALTSLKKDTP